MDKHPHIIGRQIFDIDFSSEDASYVLQDKISTIFKNRLMDEINNLFDRIIPSNRIIKLDTLNIDIGNFAFDLLETELPNKLIQKLEQELMLILLHDNAVQLADSDDIFQADKKVSYLQLLEFFLLKGSYPWWVSVTDGPALNEVLEFLFSNSSLKLKELIMRTGRNSYVRKRLLYQFSEQQIRYIIIILEPNEAEFIFDYHHNLVQVHRELILVKNEESDFIKAIWLLILSFLILDRGSHFNRKEFVKNMLVGMASNFNIDFSELLSLFASGLKIGSPELRNVDSLQTIILELFVEEESVPYKVSLITKIETEKDLVKLSYDIDLLRYFLTFGSLPWWATYSDKQSMDILLTSMLNNQPKTMAVLLRNIGRYQFSRKLLVKNFSEEILLSIVTLLEPEHVEFITDYIPEAKDLNRRNSNLKVESKDLTESIWEFVLEYLLVDRGSEFNRQMFLESNIRKLANRFNVKYSDLLTFLVQSIGVRHQSSTRHISLIRDLRTLFAISLNVIETSSLNGVAIERNSEILVLVRSKSLKDILYYWLKLGHFPWWAGEFADLKASELIEQLINESRTEALLFFKFSGQSLLSRTRLLNQVPTSIIYKFFRGLADGNKAIRYTESLILMISSIPLFQGMERKMLEKITLFSLWDTYIWNSYKSFKSGDFLKSLIENLSLWSDSSVKNIFTLLNSLVLDKQVRTQLNKVFRNIEEYKDISAIHFLSTQFPLWSELPDIEQILTEQLRSDGLKPDVKTGDEVFKEAIFLLRYFLQFNKLPEKYNRTSTVSINSLLKQLLLFLYKNRPSDLDLILNSEKYAAENIFRLHDIFRQSDSIEESNLKNLLTTKFENNILLFIRQQGGLNLSQISIFQFIEKFIKNPHAENTNSILRLLLKYPSVTGQFAKFFKDSLVYELLEADRNMGVPLPVGIEVLNSWLTGLLMDRLDRERFELIIRNYNLMLLGGIIEAGNINSYFQQLLEFVAGSNYQLKLKITSALRESLKNINESDRLIISQIPEMGKLISDYERLEKFKNDLKEALKKTDKTLIENILKNDHDELREIELRQLKRELREQQQIAQKKSMEDTLSDKDSIYVHNAGLVIMHPFFSTYFNRLKMFENGDFKTEELRHRAVHLLQYLAFGTETNEEHELVLNKILCNIPIDEPVSAGIVLTEEERAISGELLNAVLLQWEKLKNTSPESFQASFIQRDGALSRIEDNWNLKVEARGYDVLLSTLPWGLGMIKTPWMTDFIYVEWI